MNPMKQDCIDNETLSKIHDPIDNRTTLGKRDSAIIGLLFNTGMRVGETCNLKVGSLISSSQGHSIITKSAKKRGDVSHREIPITESTVNSLKKYWQAEYRTKEPETSAWFFLTETRRGSHAKHRINPQVVRRIIRKYRAKAGIEQRITPHTARHTFLTRVLRVMDLETARSLAGHSSILSTQHYLHTDSKRKRKAVEALGFDD